MERTAGRPLPQATERVVAAAGELGFDVEPLLFPEGTKTARDAAAAIGCEVSAIVKSLVFMVGNEPVLVLMPGHLRVDVHKLGTAKGGVARRATLAEVRDHTGYAAGGTPPFGHATPLAILADPQLLVSQELWAAGGTPTTVFPITPDRLMEVSGAELYDLAEAVP